MMTLVRHFKRSDKLNIGDFLSCKIDGNLYVLSQKYQIKPFNACLVNVKTGQIRSQCVTKSINVIGKEEMEILLKGLFPVEEGKTKENDFLYWYKLSNQEAIGKFAALLLEKN